MDHPDSTAMSLEDIRAALATSFDLRYTKAVAKVTERVHGKVRASVPDSEWPRLAPLIVQINRLKQEKRATVLAHRYQAPPIYHGVADLTGDTMTLARAAARLRRKLVVQCGALFMAEVTKLLAPGKTVLIPDRRTGCSVAASLTTDDVLAIKAQYPGVPVIAAINSSAAVKAISDICCTAANAPAIVESLPGDSVVLVPDQYLARNIAGRTGKKIVTWAGTCEALDGVTVEAVEALRQAEPGARIVAHIAAPPPVVAVADFAGATSEIGAWLRREKPESIALIAERAAVDNFAAEFPATRFVHAGGSCSHMARISLEAVLWSLHTQTEPVEIPDGIAAPARVSLDRMMKAEPAARPHT